MQSAGHAAAQSEHPTPFSSPFSCRCSRCRPRKRGYSGRLYSGYCCVIGFLKICFSVTPKPRTESNGCGLTRASLDQHHEEARHYRVDRRDREEHLPAEAHQLVVPQPRERRADPDEDADDQEHLEHEPERPEVVPEEEVPAVEEERRGQR